MSNTDLTPEQTRHAHAFDKAVGPFPVVVTALFLNRCNDLPWFYMTAAQIRKFNRIVDPKQRGPKTKVERTHCVRGHVFSRENTAIRNGVRVCKACAAIHNRNSRARQRGREHGMTAFPVPIHGSVACHKDAELCLACHQRRRVAGLPQCIIRSRARAQKAKTKLIRLSSP